MHFCRDVGSIFRTAFSNERESGDVASEPNAAADYDVGFRSFAA